MVFGILEGHQIEFPRGTVRLEELHDDSDAEIVRVPTPTDSPLDPLNWPRWKREAAFFTILLGACALGVVGPLVVPGFSVIASVFDISLTRVSLSSGILILGLGISSYFCNAAASLNGSRFLYISTSVLLVVSCCWAGASHSYNSLLAARLFQGLGMGAFWSIAGTRTINELFFLHERGTRVGIWNFAVIVSTNVTPVISGYIIVGLSWRWAFYLLAILYAVVLACVLLLLPETAYDRTNWGEARETLEEKPGREAVADVRQSNKDSSMEKEPETLSPIPSLQAMSSLPTSKGWKRFFGLSLNGPRTDKGIFVGLLHPILLLRHPVVVWGCLMWTVTFTWIIIQGTIADAVFQAPPWNLSTTAVGNLVGIAPLIGSALGTIISGEICDWFARFLAKRNGGIFEPEFRLIIMVPFLFISAVGTFGLGMAIKQGLSVTTCGVFLAILNFAVGMGCTGIVAYTIDVCGPYAGEAFGLAMLVKSAFAFGLSFEFIDFYTNSGPEIFFFTFGSMMLGVTLFTVPLYVYGKRIRIWADKRDILA